MKCFIATLFLSIVSLFGHAQYSLHVKVVNDAGTPLQGASLTLSQKSNVVADAVTNSNGEYSFGSNIKQGDNSLKVVYVGYETKIVSVYINSNQTDINVQLKTISYFLEPLEIKSLRVSDKAPFAVSNISKADIAANNFGQDLPFILDQSPSVVVNSDAGNGIGYTGVRIRGSDATRINVTLNGIPYNDAESQGTFFVNIPDIISSVNSIQVQRGVGSSSNGAGAFGGSINLSTNEFNEKPYSELNNSFGSFNSWKNTFKVGSGLLNNHFTIDARLSRIVSDGFIDRASSDLKSAYLSAAYVSSKSSVRFNFISGKEKTYQAWYGIPEDKLDNDRTYNIAGTEKPGQPYDNETDNYWQDHYQLFLNHSLNNKFSLNTAFFLSKGRGYYEQYKASSSFSSYGLPNPVIGSDTLQSTDLVRQLWLDNSYYGQIFSVQYKGKSDQVTLGGGWTRYLGNHFGRVIWARYSIEKDHEYYRLDALKSDYNVYTKWQRALNGKLDLFADIQYRHVDYNMNGFRNNPTVKVNRKFDFINPKAGITYTHKGYKAFISYAVANKEPNRDDFEAVIQQQPKHETLHDVELGVEKKYNRFSWNATAYYMFYKNQLILTGKINDVGAYTRVNVPESYRLGIELQGKASLTKWLTVYANFTVSRNKIKSAEEYIDDYDNGGQIKIEHSNSDIAFSPNQTGSINLDVTPVKNVMITYTGKYVGNQYLDNTENHLRKLNGFFVQNLKASYAISAGLVKKAEITFAVNNLLNLKYQPNGYTFSYFYQNKTTTENFYYPMAGRNFMIGINLLF